MQRKFTSDDLNNVDPKYNIIIKGAKTNNLKNVDLVIPKNKLVVVSGLSGSGKSSLSIDTLYAEGQRRYVESLSSYARQFMSRIKKPDVLYIKGISPAIAIDQRVTSDNSRSTVGSLTEIYDYLRLLYARIGDTFSPISNSKVTKDSINDIINYIKTLSESTRFQILAPLNIITFQNPNQLIQVLEQKGFSRIFSGKKILDLHEIVQDEKLKKSLFQPKNNVSVVIDRLAWDSYDHELQSRLGDSLGIALFEGNGKCEIRLENETTKKFSTLFELDGMLFMDPTVALFNANNSLGACPTCEGFGMAIGLDINKIVPNKHLTILNGAIHPWNGEMGKVFYENLLEHASTFGIALHEPYFSLSEEIKQLLWSGNSKIWGIQNFFTQIESESFKIQNRILLARYRGKTNCSNCQGKKLRKEALYVKIENKDIGELALMSLEKLQLFFININLSKNKINIVNRILLEINARISTMVELGLGYLNLNRAANTLSGGETQRIHLTRLLSSNLTSSMYILDEPSIGLHPRDTHNLLKALFKLRDLGNTVIVVEHEEEIIKNADYLIDMGPRAGNFGGEVVFFGNFQQITNLKKNQSLTADFLNGHLSILPPKQLRTARNYIYLEEAFKNNLKSVNVKIPLHSLVCVSGVSGSGKSSLIKDILYPELIQMIQNGQTENEGKFVKKIKGDIKSIKSVELIDQNPIGRSSRSNPITYVKAYDYIRDLFSTQQLALLRGLKPKHFSFNVDGGRCDICKGDGIIQVDMQFLADVSLECEECKGKRFKPEILEIIYKGKNIFEILEMNIGEALAFFDEKKEIVARIQPLFDVGLDYIRLGQSSSSLSGGEAQRVKLASFLSKDNRTDHILFIFDEPTTGLHFEDVRKLLDALNRLIEHGHSVIIIEHNMDVIKSADYVIDLGPEGGENGGYVLFQGSPKDLLTAENSYTATYLAQKF